MSKCQMPDGSVYAGINVLEMSGQQQRDEFCVPEMRFAVCFNRGTKAKYIVKILLEVSR